MNTFARFLLALALAPALSQAATDLPAQQSAPERSFADRLRSDAEKGDALAQSILTQAATELARLARIVIRRLFSEGDEVPVGMSGGVFGNCALVRGAFYTNLRSEYPNCSVNLTVIEPVQGALALARKGAKA